MRGAGMKKNVSVGEVRRFLSPKSNIDIMRIYYCYQLGSTFANLGLMESRIVTAMATCDRIKLTKVLQEDVPAWQDIVQRHSQLQSSTLGNLLAILSMHNIREVDLNYLKWVKKQRDFFVHRFFDNYAWPGDLSDSAIRKLCRRLRYLEYVFARAGRRIHKIFSRAGLVEYLDLGEDGALIMNVGALEGENSWLREFTIAIVRDRARRKRSHE